MMIGSEVESYNKNTKLETKMKAIEWVLNFENIWDGIGIWLTYTMQPWVPTVDNPFFFSVYCCSACMNCSRINKLWM